MRMKEDHMQNGQLKPRYNVQIATEGQYTLANWSYDETTDHFVCPNGQNVTFRYMSKKTDRYGFTRDFKVYESEDCDDCLLRSLCTKAEKGRHRQV